MKPPPIRILFEDDYYVAVDKPAGLLVIPTPCQEQKTLVRIINKQYVQANQGYRLHPCHRLDRDASGVILFSKGKKNQQLMMEEFKRRRVKKKYIALVQGHLKRKEGAIKSSIVDFDEKKFSDKPRGRLSITNYKVIQIKKSFSVVEVFPITGRTNQIRIHFSQIGHPLLGDRKYGIGKKFPVKFRRTALHASELKWIHPVDKTAKKVSSFLPKDMGDIINKN